MIKAHKIRLNPAPQQEAYFHRASGVARFAWNWALEEYKQQGRSVEVINTAADGKEDLLQDFISIITSFCARLYGQRRSKRKTEKIIAELTDDQSAQKKK